MKIIETISECLHLDMENLEWWLNEFDISLPGEIVKEAFIAINGHDAYEWSENPIFKHLFDSIKEQYNGQLDEQLLKWETTDNRFVLICDGEVIKCKRHLDNIVRDIQFTKICIASRNAPREFHLTEDDKKILLEYGSLEEDLDQIEWEANLCKYTLKTKSTRRIIDREEAIKLLGRKAWLTSIDRTTFHCSTTRECKKNKNHYIRFESGLPGR